MHEVDTGDKNDELSELCPRFLDVVQINTLIAVLPARSVTTSPVNILVICR